MNPFTNIFQGFQTTDISQLLYGAAIFKNTHFERLSSAGIFLFKINSRNRRPRYAICSKLTINTINTPEQPHLATDFTSFSSASVVDFEQLNAPWVEVLTTLVVNDAISRKVQLKELCNMLSNFMVSKIHAITKICS